eukprot:TRINITY_DN13495_c0_g1_i5.p1 TRINITY_DN13495_c0_g1~~TRINITY_DN13495_c0_g1_i5.p1  ORF type:complete len:284 (+),score=25.60 TRINITY_DN13495_c0_g1_i5:202-1053(+)
MNETPPRKRLPPSRVRIWSPTTPSSRLSPPRTAPRAWRTRTAPRGRPGSTWCGILMTSTSAPAASGVATMFSGSLYQDQPPAPDPAFGDQRVPGGAADGEDAAAGSPQVPFSQLYGTGAAAAAAEPGVGGREWTCTMCTAANSACDDACGVCGEMNPQSGANAVSPLFGQQPGHRAADFPDVGFSMRTEAAFDDYSAHLALLAASSAPTAAPVPQATPGDAAAAEDELHMPLFQRALLASVVSRPAAAAGLPVPSAAAGATGCTSAAAGPTNSSANAPSESED